LKIGQHLAELWSRIQCYLFDSLRNKMCSSPEQYNHLQGWAVRCSARHRRCSSLTGEKFCNFLGFRVESPSN